MNRKISHFGLITIIVCAASYFASAQNVVVPEWSLPASYTHPEVLPPSDFHRPARIVNEHVWIFEGQSEIVLRNKEGKSH